MTDKIRGSIGPDGPPWPDDLLADLHAGVLEPRRAAVLQAEVGDDPDARAFLAALDAVRTDLTALGTAPAPPMPDHFAARIDAALAEEAARAFGAPRPALGKTAPRTESTRTASTSSLKTSGSLADDDPAPVIDLAAARRKRGRMAAWGAGVLTAAAAAVAVAFVTLPGGDTDGGGMAAGEQPTASPTAQPPGDANQPPLALGREEVGATVPQVVNSRDYGPLGDEAGLDACLTANDIDAAKAQVVGVRPVTLDGKDGVMALLLTSKVGQFQVLVLTPDCTALFNDTIN